MTIRPANEVDPEDLDVALAAYLLGGDHATAIGTVKKLFPDYSAPRKEALVYAIWDRYYESSGHARF